MRTSGATDRIARISPKEGSGVVGMDDSGGHSSGGDRTGVGVA